MSVQTVAEVAHNYFNTLNPIAERISNDIEAIKEAYEDLWQCLSNREKDEIINESVIYPEAVLKYGIHVNGNDACDGSDEKTGLKYVVDEHTGQSWRDEHSAPFSWKTPSQLNLHMFGSKGTTDSPHKNNSAFISGKVNKTLYFDKSVEMKLENEIKLNEGSKLDGWGQKVTVEKNIARKMFDNPESPNVVLGGTCSRISGLCSRLKFLPGKTCSYEVKTVVSYAPTSNITETNFINKIKTNTVLKIQNTIRLVGGKGFISSEKKQVGDAVETENLVQTKTPITVAKLQKPSPKVAKPKSPPPPPPVIKPLALQGNTTEETLKMIVVKTNNKNQRNELDGSETENAGLLNEEILEVADECEGIREEELPDEQLLSISSIGASSESIPKSGFDFLDNW